MTEPILDPSYWRRRLEQAQSAGRLHEAVFRCPLERWQRIETKHREILARLIQPTDSILDAGCGYGRLLDLMPSHWEGQYFGVDLSPDMIALAREHYAAHFGGKRNEAHCFFIGKLESLQAAIHAARTFDWAILISVRPMVIRNQGGEAWEKMEMELRRVAKRLLYLEYDESDEGSIE